MNGTVVSLGQPDLAQSLGSYLAERGFRDPKILDLRRLTGGSTHDTWAFDLAYGTSIVPQKKPLILRRNLSLNSLDMPPQAEFALLRWLHDKGLPVAKPLLCELDSTPLAMPFVISERIIGTDLRKALARGIEERNRQSIGQDLVALQVRIHKLDVANCPLHIFEQADVAREVERWSKPLLNMRGGLHPLMRSAIHWLQSNLPTPCAPCLIHGDFKANNILWSQEETAVVLDWELAHLGDPLEDLAWTMLWTTKDDLVCGLLDVEDYLRSYERASGARIDRDRLFFWQIFVLVKLLVILRSGSGTTTDSNKLGPSHALLSRGAICLEAAMADYLLATVGVRTA